MANRNAQKNVSPLKQGRFLIFCAALLLVMLGTGVLFFLQHRSTAKLIKVSSSARAFSAYGGSASCRECHAEAYEKWAKSHHALAERLPDAKKDASAFEPPRTFRHASQQTSVRTNNGRFEIVTAGLSGTNEIFPVVRVLAENPLRQLLVEFPGGRLQATEAAFDPRTNDWFNVYGGEDRKPGEWGHWTGRGMNWNSMCAACHNTQVQKNYDIPTDTYHTAMVEHGVGCESCHGPMQSHNEWQQANKNKGLKDPTIRKLTREEMFGTCAGCHARRAEITGEQQPGDAFFDHYLLTITDDTDTFYPDGQIRDEDYEVTAFMGSRMFHKGVRCVDCHDVHTMKTKLPGNFLCLQCHGPGATNAPAINPVLHSHHQVFGYDAKGALKNLDLNAYKPETILEKGGECVNCHMPQTPYMQRHFRHDHGFTIPDPLLTKQFNIPNACDRCHAEKGTDWSLRYIEQWYGTNVDRPYRQHAQMVARARQGDDAVVSTLIKTLANEDIAYWRAVAATLLQRWGDEPSVTSALLHQLNDTNALVRQMVVQSLGAFADQADVAAALKLRLQDSSRNVRIQAARHLSGTLDTNSTAGIEYLHFLDNSADQPLGQLQRGVFEFQRGDQTNALKHFKTAMEWDVFSPGIRHEYAIILSAAGRNQEAIQQLEAACRLAPHEAEYRYKLGLAWNEAGDLPKTIEALEATVAIDPRHERAWYNLGLAKNAAGQTESALAALTRAENISPQDARIPYARATILARLGRLVEAKVAAQRALTLQPGFSQAAELFNDLSK
jgi:tetratricopeptide (TPR) repeat protein